MGISFAVFRQLIALACLALIGVSLPAKSAPSDAGKVSGGDVTADLQLLQKALSALHPGLLRYNNAEQMESLFAHARTSLSSGATTQKLFGELALLTAKIRCGHTYPNFFNQSPAVVDAVFRGQTRVPFYFVWMNRRMVVTRDLTPDNSMPVGTQILQVNESDAGAVLTRLLPYTRADGANDAKRVALLGVTGESQWEAFDIYYPLAFEQHEPNLRLVIQVPGKKPSQRTVTLLTDIEREVIRKSSRASQPDDPVFSEETQAENMEVVRMPSWGLFNSKWDWKTWLDSAIDKSIANRSTKLILDIRGNEGGDDSVGRFIISRLITKPLRVENSARLVKYRSAPEELAPYLDTWDKSFLRLGASGQQFTAILPHLPPGPWYALESDNSHAGAEMILPRKNPYTGQVVLLIDAQNSSATFQFADMVQQNHMGILLGEPTGGNQRGINGGAFFFLRLPRTGIEVDIPLIGYFPRETKPDSGLRPDVLVATTITDITSGIDPQIAAAKALVPSK